MWGRESDLDLGQLSLDRVQSLFNFQSFVPLNSSSDQTIKQNPTGSTSFCRWRDFEALSRFLSEEMLGDSTCHGGRVCVLSRFSLADLFGK
jgi:hypothetical protein